MSVGDKIRAMLGNQRLNSGQFAVNNAQMSNSIQSDFDEIAKQLEEYQKQLAAGGLPHGGLAGRGHSHTIPGISQQTFTGLSFPDPLTAEEQKELKELEHQQAFNTKIAKLAVFKALPREFRQSIVNVILWEEAIEEINNTTHAESDRLRELKMRQAISPGGGMPFFGGYTGHIGSLGQPSMRPPPGVRLPFAMLPEGITKDDLMQAHLDASLEEEISGNG